MDTTSDCKRPVETAIVTNRYCSKQADTARNELWPMDTTSDCKRPAETAIGPTDIA